MLPYFGQGNFGQRNFSSGFVLNRGGFDRGIYRDAYSGYYAIDPYVVRNFGNNRPILFPAAVVDNSGWYGTGALLRSTPQAPQAIANAPANIGVGSTSQQPLAPAPRLGPPPSNRNALSRAWRFIDYGDRQFHKGEYREALIRYRKAIAAADDLAEARFRQGLAELGRGRFARAADALRQGLARDPAWPNSEFKLADLFLDPAEKDRVFESLAQEWKRLPNDANVIFLIGVMLHFDGNPAEARALFRRVDELTGGDPAAKAFLPPAAPVQE